MGYQSYDLFAHHMQNGVATTVAIGNSLKEIELELANYPGPWPVFVRDLRPGRCEHIWEYVPGDGWWLVT